MLSQHKSVLLFIPASYHIWPEEETEKYQLKVSFQHIYCNYVFQHSHDEDDDV